MEMSERLYRKDNYIDTASGNKISKISVLCGTQNLVLLGKTIVLDHSVLRGDLANVRIGRHSIIKEHCVIRPPYKKFSKGVAFFPLHIGEYVVVEDNSIINAANIGNYVHVGKNCVIGRRAMLKDCSAIADGTYIPPETIVPSFTLWAGNPGRCVGELPETTQELMIDACKNFYENFKPTTNVSGATTK